MAARHKRLECWGPFEMVERRRHPGFWLRPADRGTPAQVGRRTPETWKNVKVNIKEGNPNDFCRLWSSLFRFGSAGGRNTTVLLATFTFMVFMSLTLLYYRWSCINKNFIVFFLVHKIDLHRDKKLGIAKVKKIYTWYIWRLASFKNLKKKMNKSFHSFF